MKKTVGLLLVAGLMLVGSKLFAEETAMKQDVYKADSVHSMVGFKVKHLGVSYVTGKFDTFDAQLVFEGEKLISVEGTTLVNSINTGDAKRDGHLKSDDFFGAEQFPSMKFKSTKVTADGNKLGVVGDLTIRDVTKVIVLQGELGGFVDMKGVRKTGIVLEGQINRQDFGLKFDQMLESGQAMVGNDVFFNIEIEANRAE